MTTTTVPMPSDGDLELALLQIRDAETEANYRFDIGQRTELLAAKFPAWGAEHLNAVLTMLSHSARKEFSFPIHLSFQVLADLMTTFFESNDPVTRSWYRGADVPIELRKAARKSGAPWYSHPETWADPDMILHVKVDRPTADDTGERFIRLRDLQRGFALLAMMQSGAYAKHFADILSENHDAGSADIFMQMVVFGEETYS